MSDQCDFRSADSVAYVPDMKIADTVFGTVFQGIAHGLHVRIAGLVIQQHPGSFT